MRHLLPKIDCVRWSGNDLAECWGWSFGILWLGVLLEFDFGRTKGRPK